MLDDAKKKELLEFFGGNCAVCKKELPSDRVITCSGYCNKLWNANSYGLMGEFRKELNEQREEDFAGLRPVEIVWKKNGEECIAAGYLLEEMEDCKKLVTGIKRKNNENISSLDEIIIDNVDIVEMNEFKCKIILKKN